MWVCIAGGFVIPFWIQWLPQNQESCGDDEKMVILEFQASLMSHRRKSVRDQKCIHSKMASKLAGENWQTRWPALQLGTIRSVRLLISSDGIDKILLF